MTPPCDHVFGHGAVRGSDSMGSLTAIEYALERNDVGR
jgi:hypothetical protein